MVSKLSAIVIGQCEDAILIGFQVLTDCIRDSLRCFIGDLDGNSKSCLPLNKRHKNWCSCLPITVSASQSPISTGDFSEALASLVGPDADGLSASTITRLKATW